MTDLEKNFTRIKNDISLTSEERAFMRTYLEAFSNAKPVHAPVPSPYAYFSFFMQPARMVALLLIIAVTGSATTVAASGNALPGETLYSLKVNVSEPLQGVLAFSSNEKADVEIRHAEERLKEIQLLSAEGKDDRIPNAALNAEKRIADARARVISLIGDDSNDSEAEFLYSLSAHADILDAQAFERDDEAGISMSKLARIARGTDDTELLASAERAQKIVDKAKDRIGRDKLPAEAREALSGELSLVMDELAKAEALGSVRGYSLAERHAYRVLALAESAERIAEKTGKQVHISFSDSDSGKSTSEDTARTTSAVEATAVMLMATGPAEDSSEKDRNDDEEDEEDVRTLKLEIGDEDESDRDDEDRSGSNSGSSDEDDSESNSGSGSGGDGDGGRR